MLSRRASRLRCSSPIGLTYQRSHGHSRERESRCTAGRCAPASMSVSARHLADVVGAA